MNDIAELDRPLTKAELLEQVRVGNLMPDEAQKRADAAGLGSLLFRPDPSKYDPMELPRWTLAMAVGWIVAGVEGARAPWLPYRTSFECWVREGEGHVPRPCAQAWLHRITATPAELDKFRVNNGPSLPEAWRKLLSLAGPGGPVSIYARDLREGPHGDQKPILRDNVPALSLAGYNGADMLHFNTGIPIYVDVVVDRPTLTAAVKPPSMEHEPTAARPHQPDQPDLPTFDFKKMATGEPGQQPRLWVVEKDFVRIYEGQPLPRWPMTASLTRRGTIKREEIASALHRRYDLARAAGDFPNTPHGIEALREAAYILIDFPPIERTKSISNRLKDWAKKHDLS